MKDLEFPMFKNGEIISLSKVLEAIPENRWTWSMLDFYGIGVAPENLEMADFESLTRSLPKGYILSWKKLRELSESLEQIYDCLIVATPGESDLIENELNNDNFQRCVVVIKALDSTVWSVGSKMDDILKKWKTLRDSE